MIFIRNIIFWILLLISAEAYPQKYFHTVNFTGPEGAHLFLSEFEYEGFPTDTISTSNMIYLGQSKGSMPLYKDLVTKYIKSGYLITMKKGYCINSQSLKKAPKQGWKHTVEGKLGKPLTMKNSDCLYLTVSNVNIEWENTNNKKPKIEDKNSFNYSYNYLNESFISSVMNNYEASIANGLNFQLYRRGYMKKSKKSILNDYGTQGLIKIDAKIKKPSVFSYTSFSQTVEVSLKLNDVFETTIYQFDTSFIQSSANGNMSLSNSIDELLFDFIERDTVIKSKVISNLDTGKEIDSWKNISLKKGKSNKDFLNSKKSVVSVLCDDNAHGSGIVVGINGYILTNHHVIANVDSIKLILSNSDTVKAELVRSNPYSDLALLKCNRKFEYTIPFITSNVKVGETVYTIGSPLDIVLNGSISKGAISGVRTEGNKTLYEVNCAINPGNSGGALVNKKGELVGVVNAKLTGYGISKMGFSIPSEVVFNELNIKL